MNRVCIYVIYDKQNIINPYIGTVLKELHGFANDIFVVCNFPYIKEGIEYIEPYTKKVFMRENNGFDAGAYKDALINLISLEKIMEYDELILTNDTYFAPLFPFDEMFCTMQEEQCDYWGITKHPAGVMESIGAYNEHIQSYFLCFKEDVLHSRAFKEYWEEYRDAKDKEHTIANFEVGINDYLKNHGYKGMAYMEKKSFSFDFQSGNPYSMYSYELIKEGRIPIIKKTNFYGRNRWFANTSLATDYIKKNCNYDISLITKYVKEYKNKGLLGPFFDFEKMDIFINNHKKIYIYGAGNWGHIVADYMKSKKMAFEGFVVTVSKSDEEAEFCDILVEREDGFIIAQEYKDICDTIIRHIKPKVKTDQIFTPCYPEDKNIINGSG